MAITRTYTAGEVFELNLDQPYELIDGELHILPLSGGRASTIASRIGSRVQFYLDVHPIGAVSGADGGFLLTRNPDTLVAPDVGFIRLDRLPRGEVPEKFYPAHPDLAVEVNSPTDRAIDAERKIQRYLAAGTSLVWLVDPKSETVTVHRPGQALRRLTMSETLSGEEVLPGFELPVSYIFKKPGT